MFLKVWLLNELCHMTKLILNIFYFLMMMYIYHRMQYLVCIMSFSNIMPM